MTGRSTREWIGRTADSRIPPRVRLRVFDKHGGRCWLSGRKITPGDIWDCDHIIALCNGGEHRESNLAPALRDKHREKSAADMAEKSKVYKTRKKHIGVTKPKGRSLPGSKASGWKKPINGPAVRR